MDISSSTRLDKKNQGGYSSIPISNAKGFLLAFFALWLNLALVEAQEPDPLHEIAEIYVDQYFEPPLRAQLTDQGQNKSAALGYFALGRLQENQDQTERAVTSYLKVLELQPDNLNLSRKCALMLARAGRQTQARELLENSLKRNEDRAFPYVMLSEFLSTYHGNNQDNKERALELAKQAVSKFPDDPLTYEHLSKMYLIGKRRNDAQKLLQGSLSIESKDPVFWLRLGKVAARVWPVRLGVEDNSKQLAILNQFYTKANEHAGSDDSVLIRSADFYASTQQYDKAEEIYSAVVKRQTDRLDIRKKLAVIYQLKGDSENYLKTLRSVVSIDPGDVSSHRKLAEAYRKVGELRPAIKHQRIALKLGKGSAKEYYAVGQEMETLGIRLDGEGKPEEAKKIREETVTFIREAAYLFPKNPDFHYLVTFPLRQLDRHKEAVKHLAKYEEIAKDENPDLLNERFYFQFGATVEGAGDIDEAAKYFQKCIEIMGRKNPQPNDERSNQFAARVYNFLGYMWLENDMHITQAGNHIKEAVKLDPKSGAIADSLGWYHFKVGEYEEALKALLKSESLLENDPDFDGADPVILDHIAQTYFALGKHKLALDYIEKAVKIDKEGKAEFKERLAEYRKQMDQSGKSPKTEASAEEDDSPNVKEAE